MKTRTKRALAGALALASLVSANLLLAGSARAGDPATSASPPVRREFCQVMPQYLLEWVDRGAANDGYLVVCFGNPLQRGPIMDFRIER